MKHILPINEGWAFVKGCETAPAAIPAGAARVDLPHCWNALDGQDGGSDYWRGPCCYLKTIEKPAGKNVYVEVEAASSVGKIIVNGVEKASHKGGYSRCTTARTCWPSGWTTPSATTCIPRRRTSRFTAACTAA